MAEFPAMRLWTDSYLADTTHLTTIEHGAYLLLLMAAWRTKSHMLPNDDDLLARYCHLGRRQWTRIKRKIIQPPLFQIDNGFVVQPRLLDEIDAIRQQVAQRSDAGRHSALKRLNRDRAAVQRNGNELSTPIPVPIHKKENGGFEESKKGETDKKGKRWIAEGTEQWRAWHSYYLKTKGVSPPKTTSKNELGWWFDNEFPQ